METNRQRTVVVTGVTGYIARHLIQELLEQGYRVRGTVRSLRFAEKEIEEDFENLKRQYPSKLQLYEADILNKEQLIPVMRNCNGVFHVASPTVQNPKDPVTELINPAVNGTLNVLEAAHKEFRRQKNNLIAHSADEFRVIVTSSDAAVAQSSIDFQKKHKDYVYTERDWNDSADPVISPYPFSKVIAEKSAFSFADTAEAKEINFKVITINPSLVIGPVITPKLPPSCSVVADILSGSLPMIPDIHWNIVDVRDVVAAHIKAFELPSATGRYIVTNQGMWMHEMAELLAKHYPNYNIPTRRMPSILLYIYAMFDSRINIRWVRQHLGRKLNYSTNKSQIELGMKYRNAIDSILDCSQSLIEQNIIQKKIEHNKEKHKTLVSRVKKTAFFVGVITLAAVILRKTNVIPPFNQLLKLK